MVTTSIAAVVLVAALMTSVHSVPSYIYPRDWTSEDVLEYLMRDQEQRQMRPQENVLFDTDGQGIGMISGVDVNSSGIVHIFHRLDRVWDINTFSENGVLSGDLKEPIKGATILALDPVTGRKVGEMGEGMFNFPHGFKFDSKDNIWVTDVGRHQVFRIPKDGTKPDLTLGEAFVPGSDDKHFCKPTDVVVAENGDFFVADGYCNRRILKFDKDGKFITKIGMKDSPHEPSRGADPFALATPHSLALVEELDIVCVADRDNRRSLCYNAGLHTQRPVGAFNRTLIAQEDIGKIYAIYYNKADKTMVAAAEMSDTPFRVSGTLYYPARAYTYGLDGREKAEWAYIDMDVARRGPSLIHALCVSRDGKDFYLADIDQRRVYKYSKVEPRIAE